MRKITVRRLGSVLAVVRANNEVMQRRLVPPMGEFIVGGCAVRGRREGLCGRRGSLAKEDMSVERNPPWTDMAGVRLYKG